MILRSALLQNVGVMRVKPEPRERYLFEPILIFAASVTGLLAFGP